MNRRVSKRLRRQAEDMTVGQDKKAAKTVYKQLKKNHNAVSRFPNDHVSKPW